MPTRTVKQLLAAMPTGMEMEQLESLLPEILATAKNSAEQPLDVATLFLETIVRAADNYQRIGPDAERTMLEWVKPHWATAPAKYFEKLSAILVNLKLDEARLFLEQQQTAATDPAVKAHLAYSLRNRAPEKPLAEN